ncbi:UNVERIFIED_CONTAM: hypothetical protein PYX00_002561 [Menopon gallinae]|uniref:Secreted protein n=1 Tax=Menopon gallinae TaxID=328185 RepID=A0AAW2IHJ2_9NEOP
MPLKGLICTALLLAISAESNSVGTDDSINVDPWKPVKELAASAMKGYYGAVAGFARKQLDYLDELADLVDRSAEEMKSAFESPGKAALSVEKETKALYEQGKADGKPDSYFDCLARHESGALRDFRQIRDKLGASHSDAVRTMHRRLRVVRDVVTRLTDVLRHLLGRSEDEVWQCRDAKCIEETVRQAYVVSVFGKKVLAESTEPLSSDWKGFSQSLKEIAANAERAVDRALEEGLRNLRRC